MTSLSRWDPIREMTTLHDAVNHLLDQAVLRPGLTMPLSGTGGQLNVLEANGKYYCQFIAPGVSPESIELTVRQNTLMLKARMPELLSEDTRKNAIYLVREFGADEFTRTVTFPKDVDPDKVEAHFENGILTVVATLAQHAQPRRITISSGSSLDAAPGTRTIEGSGSSSEVSQSNKTLSREPASVS